MAKKDNTIWWVIGVIVVLVILVGGGIGIFGFNQEKKECESPPSNGKWITPFYNGKSHSNQGFCWNIDQFIDTCQSSGGQITTTDVKCFTAPCPTSGIPNTCQCPDGEGNVFFNSEYPFYGCGITFAD